MKCDFTARGETVEEVKQSMFIHTTRQHSNSMPTLTPEQADSWERRVEAAVKEVS